MPGKDSEKWLEEEDNQEKFEKFFLKNRNAFFFSSGKKTWPMILNSLMSYFD